MKSAIILHGMPSKQEYFNPVEPAPSRAHWLSWLQKQLLLKDVLAQTLEFPEPYMPQYDKWCEVFEQFKIDENTDLIGHSCGGGFLVRWLSEHKVSVGKVVLVAPWINPNQKFATKMFVDLHIDSDLAGRTKGIHLFISLDDDKEELDTAEILKANIKDLHIKEFTDKGHFTFNDMKTEEFPELVDFILK